MATAYAKEVAHGEPAHEHLSPWPPFIALGVVLLYYGVIFRGPVIGLGILMFLAALYGWIYEDYSKWKKAPAAEAEHAPALPEGASIFARLSAKPIAWWGVMVFLVTEVMLFGGLFAIYFTAKAAHPVWPPADVPELPVFKTAINTAILVSSSITMHAGIVALKRDMRSTYLALFLLTIVLGAVFLYNQVTEYLELFGEGFNVTSGIYGSAFFTLTGVHGAHVTAGLVGIIAVFGRSLMGNFNGKRHMGVETVGIYWHFVDIVWIFLFLVIYVKVV